MGDFANNHPDRFFQVGIAEANMIGMASWDLQLEVKFLSQEHLQIFLHVEYMIK